MYFAKIRPSWCVFSWYNVLGLLDWHFYLPLVCYNLSCIAIIVLQWYHTVSFLWFLILAGTGIYNITKYPGIFRAFDPSRAVLREFVIFILVFVMLTCDSVRPHGWLWYPCRRSAGLDWMWSSFCQVSLTSRLWSRLSLKECLHPHYSLGQFNALSIQVKSQTITL